MNLTRQPIRRFAFALLLLLATWLVVEGVALTALSVLNRSVRGYPIVVAEMKTAGAVTGETPPLSARTQLRWDDYVEVLHPYFGYVADPVSNRRFWDVSDYGFVFGGSTNPVTKRAEGRLVVAVFGGSFANGVYQRLKFQLEAKAAELHRQIEVINFSSAGYKQPQQLMVLNYMLAIGAEYDVVVNVDGFNEVALPPAEALPQKVNPFFPRGWDRRVADSLSQSEVRRVGHIEFLKARRAGWSRGFLENRLNLSPTCCLIWQYGDRSIGRTIDEAERGLETNRSAVQSYTMRGPAYQQASDEGFCNDLADVWRNCSVQMNDLCVARGTRYFHFLQPNQYVPDSKPMADAESARAITEGHPYQRGVLLGYPCLLRAGGELHARGIRFTDLTGVFDQVPEPVYEDNCCHLNGAGYDIVAARIYEEIMRN